MWDAEMPRKWSVATGGCEFLPTRPQGPTTSPKMFKMKKKRQYS